MSRTGADRPDRRRGGWRRFPRRWLRVAGARVRRWSGVVLGVAGALVVVPLAAWTVTGSSDAALDAMSQIAVAGVGICVLLLSSGGYGSQRRSGAAVLWLQKPVSPVGLYLDRLVPRLGLAALVVLVLAGMLGGARLLAGRTLDPSEMASGAFTLILLFAVLVSMVHAASALGLPREELFGLSAFIAGGYLALSLAGEPWSPSLRRALALPLDSAEFAGWGLAGRPVDDPWLHLAWVVAYIAAWVVLGTLASVVTTRSPMGRSDD